MNEFIAAYPAVVIGLLSLLVTIIGVLLGALFYFFKKAIDDLADAIREMRSDRKDDRTLIGGLLDRMQKQETICEQHREHCQWIANSSCGQEDKKEKVVAG